MLRLGFVILIACSLLTCKTTESPTSDVKDITEGVGNTLESSDICLYGRNVFPEQGAPGDPTVHLDLFAKGMTLGNAYWLGVLSAIAYKHGDEWLAEFRDSLAGRFTEGSRRRPRIMEFVDLPALRLDNEIGDEDARQVTSWFENLFAGGQMLWAEGRDAAVVAFRGTESFSDVVTDIFSLQKKRGKFSGKREVPPGPGEAFGVTDEWEFQVAVHYGFFLAMQAAAEPLNELMSQSGKISVRARGEDKPRVFHPQFMTIEGILDNLMMVPEDEKDMVLNDPLLAAWNVPLPVKKAIVRNWAEVRKTEKERGEFHMDYEERNSVLSPIRSQWDHKSKKLWTTGHSLGGALAKMYAFEMMRRGYNFAGLYTYGAPRAGNNGFAREMTLRAIRLGAKENLVRFVNQNDVVPRVPPPVGIVSPPDRWVHLRGARYIVADEEVPWGTKLWILNEDVPTLIPDAPVYVRGNGSSEEEVARYEAARAEQERMAKAANFGMQSRTFLAEADELFPEYLSQIDLRTAGDWVKNHSMSQYVDTIGRYVFDGKTSKCSNEGG